MEFTKGDKMQAQTAFAMAHFAATTAATLLAALHRGKSVDDKMVKHLLKTLSTASASAPEEASGYFQKLAETAAGKHYEGG